MMATSKTSRTNDWCDLIWLVNLVVPHLEEERRGGEDAEDLPVEAVQKGEFAGVVDVLHR